MSMYYFQSPFVFSHKPSGHKKFKDETISKIKAYIDRGLCIQEHPDHAINNFMTQFSRQNDPSYAKFRFTEEWNNTIIWESVNAMMKQLLTDRPDIPEIPSSFSIEKFWFNYYPDGTYTKPHQHYGTDISGIYVVHSDGPNTTELMYSQNVGTWRYFNDIYSTDHLPEGTVLLFPSHVTHWTIPSAGERYSIAFDLNVQEIAHYMNDDGSQTDRRKRDFEIAKQFIIDDEGTIPTF